MASRRTETGDGRQAETRDSQLSRRGGGRGRMGEWSVTAAIGTGQLTGAGPGGAVVVAGGRVDDWAGAGCDVRGRVATGRNVCIPKPSAMLIYGKGSFHSDIYRACNTVLTYEVAPTITNSHGCRMSRRFKNVYTCCIIILSHTSVSIDRCVFIKKQTVSDHLDPFSKLS